MLWALVWIASTFQSSAHNICFYKKSESYIVKASFNTLLIKSSADLSLISAFIRLIFHYKFV